MTPVTSARRAAEDFARVVDGSQVDVANRYPDLIDCVTTLRGQEAAARPEFVAELRTRLLAAADTLLVAGADGAQQRPAKVATSSRGVRGHNRRLAVAAAAFVVVGGTAGVAAAAENSLPGDALYPIKRGIESAQLSLNSDDAAKGHDLIGQASTRLEEIDGLIGERDPTTRINRTLASFQRSETSGADLLFVDFQRDGDPEALAALRGIFAEQTERLQQLAARASPSTQAEFAAATALLADLDQQARVLCGNCGPDDGSSDFTDLSSAPALRRLLTAPALAAAADDLQSQAEALASKADQIAGPTPRATTTPSDSITPGITDLAGVEVPSLTSDDGPLQTSLTKTTAGGEGLLDSVDSTTGGALTPVTDSVDGTLDTLTDTLLGQ